uniref:Uncharacterized protein n=1 Tax=Tanacetum cinerariifolium TaxID=118510 RepID=A0A6L2K328_TANCI|nr:hypothetical protein [Tanacetum cinerariifolium]
MGLGVDSMCGMYEWVGRGMNYPKCGHPVNGHYCQGCAFLRKKFKEDLFTSCIEHEILQDSFEPSNDNPNIVNAPREPFVVNQEEEEKQIEEEQAANARYWNIPACYDDDDDYYAFAITPNEPVNSLSMGDEHLDTIPATESDEFIKSSVENLVPNPNFYSSDNQSFSDEDLSKEIYSNPLFDEEIISIKIDQHHFNAESDLLDSPRNHDSSIISFSKMDSLFNEFVGELTLFKSVPPGIDETDCDPEEETYFIKRLLYNNSFPHPLEEFVSKNSDAKIKSFSLFHILVEDSDSVI